MRNGATRGSWVCKLQRGSICNCYYANGGICWPAVGPVCRRYILSAKLPEHQNQTGEEFNTVLFICKPRCLDFQIGQLSKINKPIDAAFYIIVVLSYIHSKCPVTNAVNSQEHMARKT